MLVGSQSVVASASWYAESGCLTLCLPVSPPVANLNLPYPLLPSHTLPYPLPKPVQCEPTAVLSTA